MMLGFSSIVYSQKMKFIIEPNFFTGVGIGYAFDHSYYVLIPDKETRFKLLLAYQYEKENWYDLSMTPTIEPDFSIEYTGLDVSDIYFKMELFQNIFGDHYTEKYFFDIGIKLYSRFRIPMKIFEDREFFQSGSIIGDKLSHHHKLSLILLFLLVNDKFWTYSGLGIRNQLSIEAGSEFDWRFWSFFSNSFEIEVWIPIINRFLFIHIKGIGELISSSFNRDVQLAFYNYSILDKVRGVDPQYRDTILLVASAEIISRFLEFEILFPMSLGIGIFGDTGLVSYNIKSISSINLKSSLGTFIEYKVIEPLRLRLITIITLHIGALTEVLINNNGEISFTPKFYFNFKFGF